MPDHNPVSTWSNFSASDSYTETNIWSALCLSEGIRKENVFVHPHCSHKKEPIPGNSLTSLTISACLHTPQATREFIPLPLTSAATSSASLSTASAVALAASVLAAAAADDDGGAGDDDAGGAGDADIGSTDADDTGTDADNAAAYGGADDAGTDIDNPGADT